MRGLIPFLKKGSGVVTFWTVVATIFIIYSIGEAIVEPICKAIIKNKGDKDNE